MPCFFIGLSLAEESPEDPFQSLHTGPPPVRSDHWKSLLPKELKAPVAQRTREELEAIRAQESNDPNVLEQKELTEEEFSKVFAPQAAENYYLVQGSYYTVVAKGAVVKVPKRFSAYACLKLSAAQQTLTRVDWNTFLKRNRGWLHPLDLSMEEIAGDLSAQTEKSMKYIDKVCVSTYRGLPAGKGRPAGEAVSTSKEERR